ncbi:MAG TPA: aldehyde ferredoxin oxidoreductase [Clostridiales bacterium]|nr:aldehyde ferredoxin oxidoreductase [Clostridiales bacterium]
MIYGYSGKILEVDLTKHTTSTIPVSEEIMRKYMGGKGLIGYFMRQDDLKSVDPLSDQNVFYYMTGVMSGIPNAGTSRIIIGAKSPITKGFGMSESGGFVAADLKKTGWDGIIVRGISEKPVYLWIKDGEIAIKDATHLWGKENGEVHDTIQRELGEKNIRISQIGPAGENLVQYACIMNDLKHACGRNGLGAVMGSKNLKAIAIKGTEGINFKDRKRILEISKWYSEYFKENPLSNGLHMYGTASVVEGANLSGILPTRNFRDGFFEQAENLTGKRMADTILIRRDGCFGCPVRCKRTVEVKGEKLNVNPKFGGPEYETIGAFGSLCGIGNLEMIAKANERCNNLGLDTISAGVSIAFAMECFERKIIDDKTTFGLGLEFGNEDVLLQLVEDIAYKRDLGALLAKGVMKMSEILGEGTEDFAMHVKGQELPMHDPRGKTGVGLAYSLSPTGADHMQAAHDTMMAAEGPVLEAGRVLGLTKPVDVHGYGTEKAYFYSTLEKWWSFLNMVGVCFFIPQPRGSFPIDKFLDLLNLATGWDVDVEEAMEVGERGINLARIINYEMGVNESTEDLPERLYQPLENGASKGKALDKDAFHDMKKSYYELMGWDESGKPKEEILKKMGL